MFFSLFMNQPSYTTTTLHFILVYYFIMNSTAESEYLRMCRIVSTEASSVGSLPPGLLIGGMLSVDAVPFTA